MRKFIIPILLIGVLLVSSCASTPRVEKKNDPIKEYFTDTVIAYKHQTDDRYLYTYILFERYGTIRIEGTWFINLNQQLTVSQNTEEGGGKWHLTSRYYMEQFYK